MYRLEIPQTFWYTASCDDYIAANDLVVSSLILKHLMGENAPCKDMTSNVNLIQISVSEVYLFKLNSKF